MDGKNRSIIVSTDLIAPISLTLDYDLQLLFWIDGVLNRIETSNTDGSNRENVMASQLIFRPFDITLYRGTLFFSDVTVGLNRVDVNGGAVTNVFSSTDLCEEIARIEVVSSERQQNGMYCLIITCFAR